MLLGLLSLAAAITVTSQDFDGKLVNYQHLKVDNQNFADETVLVWTTKGDLWVSHSQGSEWAMQGSLGKVTRVYPHPFANERVYIYNSDRSIFYSDNHARSFRELRVPGVPDYLGSTLEFNKQDPNYMLLHTIDECDGLPEDCTRTAWYTKDAGSSWLKLNSNVQSCRFVTELVKQTGRDMVFCNEVDEETSVQRLVSSNDYFRTKKTHFDSIVGMALDAPFLIVAAYNDNNDLISYVTLDGEIFAPANFPGDIKLSHDVGYTVIDTSTQTLFMDVTSKRSFGDIVKSNANGTDFTTILKGVNRSPHGYVDFEKVSIEGVAFANVVDNADDVLGGSGKIIKSRISHSDGAFWDPLAAPDGECSSKDCSLHLHGYTERYDTRNTPDSPSAVGLIISTGNVGDSLLPISEASTYLSGDAGISWTKIASEPLIWEYGDSGSIIVTARTGDLTDTINYSLDEGQTWTEYKFSETPVQILNLANIPSDTSRKFLVFTRGPQARGDATTAFSIAFDTPRVCVFDDFTQWTPSHPHFKDSKGCLFGHQLEYMRKKIDADCTPGKMTFGDRFGDKPLGTPNIKTHNCECTAQDFECDYNHQRAADGTCKLIQGLTVPTQAEQCANGGIFWREITGYRRIAIDTCRDGEELGPKEYFPCPGMEEEFKKHFAGGAPGGGPPPRFGGPVFATAFQLFAASCFIAIGALVLAAYLQKSGRIQLDEGERRGRWLAAGVGALAFVSSQIKEVADRLLGSVETRFASSRGVYARLDDEERSRILSEHLSDDEMDNEELELYSD